MRAIYINLDPYLAAFAAWLKANPADPDTGERATPPPHFDPLPLAITVPLGDSAALFCPVEDGFDGGNNCEATVDGQALMYAIANKPSGLGDELETNYQPGLSALDPDAKNSVAAIPSNVSQFVATAAIMDGDDTVAISVPFTVLVRREQASGPIDLVDFTPPAAVTAASINAALGGTGAAEGSPLKGVSLTAATNAPAPSAADIRSALVAAGSNALEGVQLGGAFIRATGRDGNPTMFIQEAGEPGSEVTFPLLAGEGVVDQIGGDGES